MTYISTAQKELRDDLFARGLKRCSRCTVVKKLEQFRFNRATRDGYNSYCGECYTQYLGQWRNKNAGYKKKKNADWYVANRERISRQARETRLTDWVFVKVKQVKAYAWSKKLPFDLDAHVGDLERRFSAGVCELSGVKFRHLSGKRSWDSPSIDRINPDKGYVYDNVRLIVWGLNVAFSNWGEDQTADLMRQWLETRDAVGG